MTAFWIDVRSLFYYFIFQFRNRRYERSGVVSSRNDICSRITQCNHTRFTFHCLKVSPPPSSYSSSFTGTAEVGFSVSEEGMARGPVGRAERLQVR